MGKRPRNGLLDCTVSIVVTQLGAITGAVLVLAVVLAAAETIRTRSAWIVPFLLVLLAGEEILMNAVKLACGPRAAHVQPGGGRARSLVSERPFGNGGGVLCGCCAPTQPPAGTRRPHHVHGHRRRRRSRRRIEPGAARRPLALRCDRRPPPRMELVRGLRNRVRRSPPAVRGAGRARRGGRARRQIERAGRTLRSTSKVGLTKRRRGARVA